MFFSIKNIHPLYCSKSDEVDAFRIIDLVAFTHKAKIMFLLFRADFIFEIGFSVGLHYVFSESFRCKTEVLILLEGLSQKIRLKPTFGYFRIISLQD